MKKLLLILALLISVSVGIFGCQKSEREKVDKLREENDISLISDEQLRDKIVAGKQAFMDIFQGIEEEELLDEFEMVYSPFTEEYNSPEKIAKKLEAHYSKEYTERLMSMIPAVEVQGRYALPLGDMGMMPDYSSLQISGREDIDEKSINVSYKMEEGSSEVYKVYFEYIEGEWKITDEIREFEKE